MEDGIYDVVIFDTAPTGHTIRLLELPVDWSKHIEQSANGSGNTCLGPVALIEDSKIKYDNAIEILRDKSQTEFIFVMQPEETSLTETVRASKELKQIGIDTTQIIVNGLIPEEEAVNPFFKSRYEMQKSYLNKALNIFEGKKIQCMELQDSELKGIEMFRKCAEKLFKGSDNK
jgi:arsenite-transporting ATPase